MPFLAQFDEPAVVDVVVVNTPEGDLYGAVADIIDESAVVTDHQYRTRTGFEEVFEPLDRLDIQMVGRLVE